MIPKYKDRTQIVANMLNPAYCAEILRSAIKAYNKESKNHIPFELLFLILPLILNNRFYDKLPKTTKKKFYEWFEENDIVKIYLSHQIKNLVPYTKEALLFLIYHEVVSISDDGNIVYNTKFRAKKVKYIDNNKQKKIIKKSELIGRWLTNIGDSITIYATIGIRP